jgi:hypothetical protein
MEQEKPLILAFFVIFTASNITAIFGNIFSAANKTPITHPLFAQMPLPLSRLSPLHRHSVLPVAMPDAVVSVHKPSLIPSLVSLSSLRDYCTLRKNYRAMDASRLEPDAWLFSAPHL